MSGVPQEKVMDLIGYVTRRIVLIVPILLGASVVMFVLTMLIPGDPALMRLGNFATAEQLRSLREEMGLTKPPHERYLRYLGGLLRGDMGRSWRTGNLVLDDLWTRFPASLELGLCSLLLSICVGIPLGVQSAAHKDALVDYGGKCYGILGVAMPIFWFGLGLVYIFYFKLGVAPAPTGRIDMLVSPPSSITGLYLLDSLLQGDMEAWLSSASHLLLPVITLAFATGASIARMTYTSMRKVLTSQFIIVGHAYGFSPRAIVFKFALKNALMPVLTLIGLQVGFLIGGVVLVEVVFSLPGIGRYAVDSLLVNDFAPVQGFVLLVLVVYLLVNLVIDLLYGWLNPQVRHV
jgi:peptide/nickel transport system permease protein